MTGKEINMDNEILETIEEKVQEAIGSALEDKIDDLIDEIADEMEGRFEGIIDDAVSDSIIEYFSEGIEEFLSSHQLALKDGTTLQMRQKTRVMSPDKKKVIKTFRDYVRRYIPDLNTCKSFQQESRNRRIIMKLNYYGLEDVSAVLLAVKSRL